MDIEENQQFICKSKPFCLCVGEDSEWDECDCFTQDGVHCVACGAEMVLIDFESGEEVRAA